MPRKTKAKKKKTSAKANAKKKMAATKKPAKKVAKAKLKAGKTLGAKRSRPAKRKIRARRRAVEQEGLSVRTPQVRSTTQSGDLHGLPRMETADAESVT